MADDPTIQWALANPFGILMDQDADAWHSGHASDALELPTGGLLISTEKGGVWTVSTTGATQPLSDSWESPDVNCLAAGIDDPNAHFFAGCPGGVIRETDLGAAVPLLSWVPVANPLPTSVGNVRRIVIIRGQRRIIAACDGGLFWATIPSTTSNPGCLVPFGPRPPRGAYQWQQASVNGGFGQGVWDVTVASTTDTQRRSDLQDPRTILIVAGGVNSGGIFVGQWDGANNLALRSASLAFDDGTDATYLLRNMGTTSVSSCDVRPTVVYAACAWPDGRLDAILRSQDGGQTWRFCASHVEGGDSPLAIVPLAAGVQGATWNNCIAASPKSPDTAAVGWVSGPFITLDSGKTFKQVTERTHLHDDIHTLRFMADTADGLYNVYVCSDGGVARIDMDAFLGGDPQPIQSNYNRLLPTHQCYATFVARQFYGTLAVSPHDPGFLSVGVQDSGNIYSSRFPAPEPWRHIDFGDGGWNAFLSDGTLLRATEADAVGAALTDFGPDLESIGVVPVGLPATDAAGIHTAAADVVRKPHYRRQAALMTAIAGVGNQLYGCFGDSSVEFPSAYHWDQIATLPNDVAISAVGSYDGSTIYVGASGRMFVVDSGLGQVLVETPVVLPSPAPGRRMKAGAINRIVAQSETDIYAMMNGATANWPSPTAPATTVTISAAYVLRLDALQWLVTPGAGLPNEPLFGLEAVAEPQSHVPNALFVSTDDRVYISRDHGATWQRAAQGLPRNPHCADLRFVTMNAGAWICLGTFGRSVYLAQVR